MLPKNNRLNLTRERFAKGDAQFSERSFKLIVKKGMTDGPKIGFIVSGKVGKATTRNKVKRIISEVVEKNLDNLPRNTYLIFIAFPQASTAGKEELVISVDKALSKV